MPARISQTQLESCLWGAATLLRGTVDAGDNTHPAITDTALDELWVVYPGTRSHALDDRITVRPLHDCLDPR